MKFNSLILIFLTSILIIISGCSSTQDCSLKNTNYIKYQLNTNTNKCQIFQKITPNVCGNRVPENGETYCNCQSDVKKDNPIVGCSGTKGEYLSKSCSVKTKTCILNENKKVISKNKVIDFKNSYLTIKGNFNLNYPFILSLKNPEKIKIGLSLYKTQTNNVNIKNIIVKNLKILDSNSDILSSFDYNKGFSNVGENFNDIFVELNQINKYKSIQTIKVELEITYTKETLNSKGEVIKTENKIETLKSSLGRWNLINPNFFDPKKRYN